MRTKPSNPNTGHPDQHILALAATGSGKSQALNHYLRDILKPRSGARVIMWDHSYDYPGYHYETKAGFLKALRTAIKAGKGFRIAYSGNKSPENFEWWCEVVWSILDGRYLTYAIAEELSAVSATVGKAGPKAAELVNEGRKYGLRFVGTSQKPQEIAKTFVDQCRVKLIGRQNGRRMIKKWAEEIGIEPARVAELKNLEFFIDQGTADEPEKITIKYRKVTGVKIIRT